MKLNDLISVIVPIYNSDTYLEECINSIINQTYQNIEILLINDGSTDNSLKICKKLEQKDRRIKIINKKNTGVSDSRNIGIEKSNGKYILYVDSDDILRNDMIERLYKTLIEKNVDIVRCNYIVKGKDKEYKGNLYNLSNSKIERSQYDKLLINLLTNNNNIPCYVWLLLIKKEKITKFDRELYFMEDTYFFMQQLYNVESIYFLNEYLYYYRYNDVSASKDSEKVEKNIYGIIEAENKIKSYLKKNNKLNVELERSINSYIFTLIISKIKLLSDYNESKSIIQKIFKNETIITIINNCNKKEISKKIKLEYFFIKKEMYQLFVILLKMKKILRG